MDNLNLQSLSLESKWPRLAKLQAEIAGLSKQVSDAERQVQMMRNALGPAKEKDLNTAAAAIRSGKDVPHGTNEDAAKRQLESSEKTYAVMQRALQGAREDLGNYLAKHQGELYQDVAQARAEIAAEAARAASVALQAYSRYEDLHYVLKDLTPPPQPVDPDAPPQRLTQSIIGVATTRSAGPARGDVEAMLQHLISLDSGPVQEDAA